MRKSRIQPLIRATACCLLLASGRPLPAQSPPSLAGLFPMGGRAGTAFEIQVPGKPQAILCSQPEIQFQPIRDGRFRVKIGPGTPLGAYDIQAWSKGGLSPPRRFFVSAREQQREREPNNTVAALQSVKLNSVVVGRIENPGDVDLYQFSARSGQVVVIECWAERVDSKLRAILQLFNSKGRPLAVSHGFHGVDPLIAVRIPEDGLYRIRVNDLTYTGGPDHTYRLDVDAGPRVSFVTPAVIQYDRSTDVTLHGWNLGPPSGSLLSRRKVSIRASRQASSAGLYLRPEQVVIDALAYRLPKADTPTMIGLTNVPASWPAESNLSSSTAHAIVIPSEVTGQLTQPSQRRWYRFQARAGEVLHIQSFGQRLGSPLDLDVAILDAEGKRELGHFHDELKNPGGRRFPSRHLDAEGRWVAPRSGAFLLVVRNLIAGLKRDPRRVFTLRIRREVSDFDCVLVPREESPRAFNVPQGGRALFELLAFRQRGMNSSIRISAAQLPPGVHCEEVWMGPGVDRAPLVLTVDPKARQQFGKLQLRGRAEKSGAVIERTVSIGTMVRPDLPNGRGRLVDEARLAVAGSSRLRLNASCARKRYQQGSIVDVDLELQRPSGDPAAAVALRGVGLPNKIRNRVGAIPSGQTRGYLSLYLPADMPPGHYSLAVQGQTKTVDAGKNSVEVTLFSNVVSFEVYPAPFILEVNLDAPRRVRRGAYVQVKYTARRKNGFIGKIHTELRAAGPVVGLRGRGVTFVGQTESGTLQIIANDDAALGRQRSLRLEAVGTIEDQPVYLGSCFLHLEIVD